MSDLIKLYEHPCYSDKADEWQTYQDLFDGCHGVLRSSRYLWLHELENQRTQDAIRIRNIRETRSRYLNLVEPVISRYTSLFFKDDPVPDDKVTAMMGDDIDDVSGSGQSLVSFLKEQVLRSLLLFGRPIVLTDAPAIQADNLAQQRALNLRPSFEVLNPLSVKDWEIETEDPKRRGQFKFLRYEYEVIEPRSNATEEPREVKYSKVFRFEAQRGADTGTYIVDVYRADGTEKDDNAAKWSLVPEKSIVKTGFPNMPIRAIEGEDSWIKDVSQQQLKLFNLESTRDSIQYYQAHQRLFFTGVSSEEQKKALAEYTIGFLPSGSTIENVEPVNTQSIDANIQRTIENLFKVAFNQSRQVAADSKQVSSQGAQQESKDDIIALVVSQIESLENLTNSILKDYAFFKSGDKNFDGKVEFAKDIKPDDIQEQITIYQALRDEIVKVPSWRKASLKKFAQYQDLPESDEILKDIDSIPDAPQTQQNGQPQQAQQSIRDKLISSLGANGQTADNSAPTQ